MRSLLLAVLVWVLGLWSSRADSALYLRVLYCVNSSAVGVYHFNVGSGNGELYKDGSSFSMKLNDLGSGGSNGTSWSFQNSGVSFGTCANYGQAVLAFKPASGQGCVAIARWEDGEGRQLGGTYSESFASDLVTSSEKELEWSEGIFWGVIGGFLLLTSCFALQRLWF